MSDIIIKTVLPGAFQTKQKAISNQTIKLNLFNKSELRTIKHTDATTFSCFRLTTILEPVVDSWIKGDCPYWETPREWKRKNAKEKIKSYVKTFDEGFGVSFE